MLRHKANNECRSLILESHFPSICNAWRKSIMPKLISCLAKKKKPFSKEGGENGKFLPFLVLAKNTQTQLPSKTTWEKCNIGREGGLEEEVDYIIDYMKC